MNIPEQYLKALVEISRQINSILQPEELIEKILDIALQQLSAERGFILLKDEQNEEQFTPHALRNINTPKISEVKDISHSTVDMVLQTAKPLLTFDALSDERFDAAQSIVLHQIRSIACVPLLLKGEMLGVLYIDSRGEKARFTRQSLEFLQAFANQAAVALENARLLVRLQQENAILKEEFHRIYAFKEIIGRSKAMEPVYQIMGKVLNNDSTILITGETGTGKELIARAIHYNGHRKDKPFVAVNCGAIPENLIESELFGHKKGAFTGAVSDKKGLIESADGGSLFLDEIGELPMLLQVKLLRFLQDRKFTPVGEVRPKSVDVRILSATNRDLQAGIKEGVFREDLFYRLNIIHIGIPPLRERKKDIPLLCDFFMKKYNHKLNKNIGSIRAEALQNMLAYAWPGNVQELENSIERAVVLDTDEQIGTDDLLLASRELSPDGIEAGMSLEEISKNLLTKTLSAVDGNKTRAADMMGVSLRWIHYKMKEWQIPS
ncbi:MAG TPA: GAF domain-containing protein [Bacteroidetes bacterium]|nr:GAF domain-containing protein [Bacteroidota bacterium]